MTDVTILGDINADIITYPIQKYPEEGKQIIVPKIDLSTGGCACNLAIACARLGVKTRLIGKVGNDVLGNYLLDTLKKVGVDTKIKIDEKENTGITIATGFKNMSRSFITFKGANNTLSEKDFDLEDIKGKIFVITGFNLLNSLRNGVKKLFEYAQSKGMKTALDPNWDPDGWTKERIEEIYGLLKVTDWFFPDIDEAREISFTDREMLAITKLLMFGPKTVCLKMGERGCLLGTKESIKLVNPFSVKPINTTGAGDVFLAGFIKSYLSGKPLEDVVMFSNAAAALSITESGLNRYPTQRKVIEFMKKVRI